MTLPLSVRVMRVGPGRVVTLCLLLLLISLGFTSLIALQPSQTLSQGFALLLGIILFVVAQNILRAPSRLARAPLLLTWMGVILAVIAPFSVHWDAHSFPLLPSVLSRSLPLWLNNSIHPNVMAGYLVIFLPFPLAELVWQRQARSTTRSIFNALALFSMLFILLVTQSRAALLALAVVLIMLFSLTRGKRWIIFSTLLMVVLFAIGIWFLSTSSSVEISLALRREAWQRALYLIQDFPLGVGMGFFTPMVAHFYPFFLSLPGEVPHAHNLLLQIAVDLGLPGLFAWACLMGAVLRASWQIFQGHSRALGGGLLLSQIALLAHGVFDAVTWGMVRPAIVVWLLWAVALAAQKQLTPVSKSPKAKAPIVILFVWILLAAWGTWRALPTYRALDFLRPQFEQLAEGQTPSCERSAPAAFSSLSPAVRVAYGSALLSLSCPDLAALVLPELTPQTPRADLLAYAWGRVAWQHADLSQAAVWWLQAPVITNLLILQAKDLQIQDLQQAAIYFRAAVLAAPSNPTFAPALFAYVNFLKSHSDEFNRAELTATLSAAYPPGSGENLRIEAEQTLALRQFSEAQQQLTQAIALGMNDSETWFLLAEIMRLQADFDATSAAYTAALQAPLQVPQRQTRYAYRFATFLIEQDHLQEALPLLEQVARQEQVPIYWDELSQLYAQSGQSAAAHQACQQAHDLALPAHRPSLQCTP